MGDFSGRYFSSRDRGFLHSINAELFGRMIQTVVILYKVAPTETLTNVYGEADQSNGKFYFPGIEMTSFVDRGDITTENDGFGPDRKQNPTFSFREKTLMQVNFFPQVGDLILFNERYCEVDGVDQEQFLVGQPDKSLSIICKTHYTRFSKLNLTDRQN